MRKTTLFFVAAGLLAFAACKKDDKSPGPSTGPTARVMFMNGIISSDSIKVKINDTMQNSVPSLYYSAGTGYVNVRASSSLKFTFYNPANPNADNFSITENVGANKTYSVFFAGASAAVKSAVFIEDDLTVPASGKAKVRFVNLSPDPSFDSVTAVLNTSSVATNVLYKQVTPFMEVDAGTYSVKIGNPNIFTFEELTSQQLINGKIYTYVLTGIQASGTYDLKLNSVIIHN